MEFVSKLYEYTDVKTVIIATVVFVLLFEYVKHRRRNKGPPRNLPPGPRGWPILGNMPSLDPKAPYKTLNKMAEEYGPIYSLQFGSFPVVVLNNYVAVKEAFIKQGEDFDDRPRLVVFEMSKLGKGMLLNNTVIAQSRV